ncbi:MAG: RagB/SusD family nutrient uptake outer membrane protein [Mangrovibacterium sp.]
MKKNIFIVLAAVTALCLGSCSDVLDLEPLDSYNPETVFSDADMAELFVNQRYPELKHGFSTGLRWISDEGYHNHNGTIQQINMGAMTPDLTGGFDTWEYYSSIRHCNIFLENSDKLPVDDVLKQERVDRMTGEVIFLRALFYFDLANRYNGVPLITKTLTENDELLLPRNSYDECMTFVVEELDKAAALLPVSYDSENFGRATKGAALAYKARALLYMASPLHNTTGDKSKWQLAADAAKAVIDLKDGDGNLVYALDEDYAGMFLNYNSQEIIFERLFNNEYGTYIQMYELPSGYDESWANTNVTQEMVDAYEMKDGTLPSQAGSSYDPLRPYINREPRFYASVLFDGAMFKGREVECWINDNPDDILNSGLDSDKNPIGDWNASATRYTMRKFMDESLATGPVICPQPWIYMRLGEIYLDYAEALYQTGNEPEARKYLNLIRERARSGLTNVLPDITVSGDALWKKIVNERRVELAFEDHRYWDVRRWKIADQTENVTIHRMQIYKNLASGAKTYSVEPLQERKFYSQHYFLPIPRGEMNKDPNLEQNPGYN